MRRSIWLLVILGAFGCDGRTMTPTDGSTPPPTDGGTAPGADGGTTPGTDGGSMMDADASVTPTSPLVDPTCTDGMYSEALPTSDADISDLVASCDSSDPTAFIEAVLERRYSTGHELVSEGRVSRDFVEVFLNDTSTAQAVIRQLPTVVHECGHF